MKEKRLNIRKVAGVGLLAAVVFASSYLRINIPTPTGTTGVHLGNNFCVMSGLLMGPWLGGLAGGIGSMFFDLTNPLYVASAPFTFLFKFAIGFVSGLIAFSGSRDGKDVRMNFAAATAGSLSYVVLYLGKNLIEDLLFLRVEMETALLTTATRSVSSLINAVAAILISVPLAHAVRAALERANLYRDFGYHKRNR